MSKVELIRKGLKMYSPTEGNPTPDESWYGIYFDHVPALVAEIDILTTKVAALEDALRPFGDAYTKLGGGIESMSLQGWYTPNASRGAEVVITSTNFAQAAAVLAQ